MTCRCSKPTKNNAYVCDGCLDDLSKALADVTWLNAELAVTLAGERGIDYAADSTHHKSTPLAHKDVDDDGDQNADRATALPFNAAAAEAIRALHHALAKWVRYCAKHGVRHQSPHVGMPDDGLPEMTAWLLWRVDGLAYIEDGHRAVTDIVKAVTRAHRVIDRPTERKYVGPCTCGRDLYAKPDAKTATCQACELTHDVEALGEWMRSGVSGRLVTAFEGSTLLGRFALPTAQKTIDKWHQRKLITDHGHDQRGRRLYLIDDLLTLAARNTTRTA